MKKNRGFTLVELIVVLVILAILAAVLLPALLGYIDKAKERLKKTNLRRFISDIDGYLITIEKNGNFYKRYVPFETKDSYSPWFYEDGVKNLIDDTNEYLKMIEALNKKYE